MNPRISFQTFTYLQFCKNYVKNIGENAQNWIFLFLKIKTWEFLNIVSTKLKP